MLSAALRKPRGVTNAALPASIAPAIFKVHEVGDSRNTLHMLHLEFTSTAVNTTTNQLSLIDIGFRKENYPSSRCGYVREVYFRPLTASDTLPSPLVAGTKYYIATADTTGGTRNYDIYKAAGDSDGASIPGWITGENVLPGQGIAQDVLKIDLTSQGSGTFIIYTKPGVVRLHDLKGNTCHSEYGTVNRNECFDIGVDADGKFYIDAEGSLAKNEPLEGGGYNGYGKGLPFINNDTHRTFIGSKRSVIHAFVFTPIEPEIRNVPKFYGSSAGVNTTNDTVTPLTPSGTVSKITDGGETYLRAVNGGTLPAGVPVGGDPAQSTAVYTRETGSFTKIYTLHPTRADALANTNRIDLTSTGSGQFVLYQPKFAGDLPRNGYFTKWLVATGAGNNICSGNLNFQTFNNTGLFTFDIITTSGSDNGKFGTTLPGIAPALDLPELSKVDLYIPPAAVAPTCVDTGLPLTSGTYWITRAISPAESIRLHRTFANALANVGVATSAATCIKFSSAGDGAYGGFSLTHAESCGYDIRHEAPPGSTPLRASPVLINDLLPYGQRHQVITVVDFNDPAESFARLKVWVNGSLVTNIENGGKGLTAAAAVTGGNSGTLLNSDQFHVPFKGKFYASYFGASDGAITETMVNDLSAHLLAKHDTYVPPPALYRTDMTTFTADDTTFTTDEVYGA